MQDFVATKEIKKIVDSKDNIIDQLKELRRYGYKRGVRQFIDRVIRGNINGDDDNNSKYILYCVVKYFYQLDVVKEEKLNFSILLPCYALSDTYDYEFVQKLVTSKDNIIDQCKLLREHRDSKDVQEYISLLQKENDDYYESKEYDYVIYCINKYYYGRKIPKIERPQPSIRLYAYIKEKPIIEEPVDNFTPLEDIKKGDRIKILNGVFKDLTGLIVKTNFDKNEFTVSLNLFGQESIIDLDNQYDKFLKIDDDNES